MFSFDFGKARAFVIEKALEVLTQVDQQMIAISDLNRLWSALFERLRVRTGTIATHHLDPRMRLQPGNDGRGFAIRQQINRTVALQIHQYSAVAVAFFQHQSRRCPARVVRGS